MSLQLITNSNLKVCNTCKKPRLSRLLRNDPKDHTLKKCRACYRKAHTELLNKSGVKCSTCPATETSQWHKDPEDHTLKKCNRCYRAAHTELLNNAGISCSTCQKTEATSWHKDPKDPSLKKCRTCYENALSELSNKSGFICSTSTCQKTEATRWYNDPKDHTLKKCRACYRTVGNVFKRNRDGSQTNGPTPDSLGIQSDQGATSSIYRVISTDFDNLGLDANHFESTSNKRARFDEFDELDEIDLDLFAVKDPNWLSND